ncbi:mechanosensitive ion channel family protein [Sulfuriroseicoccus oceanibius]|uniref:Mechanosensing system component YbdG n=1 Tax=Sulfuriroseicoccus oceanibius TaxID=2707525 RepID=A0A6B3L9M4_9BACT|nr:mechanosensitive ion channel domain-containing protein [Sulfuriroseicoccus oceanibius]QQL43999.1 mechanosensitive ion channel [Sulfuriroseicoccus oceanibius]
MSANNMADIAKQFQERVESAGAAAPQSPLIETIRSWLESAGVVENLDRWSHLGALSAILLIAVVAHFIGRVVVLRLVKAFAIKSPGGWDDEMFKAGVFRWLVHLLPAVIIQRMSANVDFRWGAVEGALDIAVQLYIVVISLMAVLAVLRGAHAIIRSYKRFRNVPLRGVFQILGVLCSVAALIIALGIVLDRSPTVLLSGLGAATAIIMLVFKDSLLGFTAGIQLAGNRMVSVGDWIEMPKYGADGNVLDVALTSVKVQNWDKTITTVPTYALISDAFKNWRGMEEAGGRRVKRSLYLDMGTIAMATREDVERFRKVHLIKDYIGRKEKEIGEWNERLGIGPDDMLVNGRRITNVGTFRAYAKAYLENHPQVNLEMTLIVRQLQPTDLGLPIELYFFIKDKRWAHFEDIQSDVFDHLLAVAPEFGLRVFQRPSGGDLRNAVGGREMGVA